MEQELARLLSETQSSSEAPRKAAEQQLRQQYTNPAFPSALISIGAQEQYPTTIRQSALLILKRYVQETWSSSQEEFEGRLVLH